ncbi:hypothetical protein AGMMS50229_12480 [Campylobacterota bacterium]|nr:hypothetical protein AGMMS50229_12480 [Campylobacterota bacterium]
MGTKREFFESSKEAMKFLEGLALGEEEFIFRGQPSAADRLSTTLRRFAGVQSDERVKDLLRRFEIALAKIGIFPFEKATRLDWLEYARHCGVPLPVIDFTYSPYVALFFAFNQMSAHATKDGDLESYVCVLALGTKNLAKGWAKAAKREFSEEAYLRFKTANDRLFEHGFATDILQLIPFPGKKNRRMMRQMGLLLYDSLDYNALGFDDIESFIEAIDEGGDNPTLYKIYIHKLCAQSVFERLELMNITGSQLILDEHGAAMDVINSYFYNSRIHFRDLDNK